MSYITTFATSYIFVKDCSTCQHKKVCKYKSEYEQTTDRIEKHLEELRGTIDPDVIEAAVRCKLYSAEQVVTPVTPVNPFDGPITWPNTNPIIYGPSDVGKPSNPDPYKITCENIN